MKVFPKNRTVLVTLLCPACRKRVAIMDHFPTGSEKVGDIVLIDGRTARHVNRLVCRKCLTHFPPTKALIPEHVFLNPHDPSAAT